MESSQVDHSRPKSAKRLTILLAILAFSATGIAILYEPESDSALGPWVVSGPSMAPTLLGPSVRTRCLACNLSFRVSSESRSLPPDKVLCAHCGKSLQLDDDGFSAGEQVFATMPKEFPERGDLIALDKDSQTPFIKRIVGIPGDIIDADGEVGHLTVNGDRIEDTLANLTDFPLPNFLVDRDLSRADSRWTAQIDWRREKDRRWVCQTDIQPSWSGWLTYQHFAVYRRDRPSPVLDDYQFNVGANRKLIPVDRIVVSGQAIVGKNVTIECAFWTPDGVTLASAETSGGEFFLTSRDAIPLDLNANQIATVKLDESRPVAFRVNGNVELAELEINRPIQYRLRSWDEREPYPLTVPPGMLFVLGDNVPVSKDSREFGCVSIDQAIGLIVSPTRRSDLNR